MSQHHCNILHFWLPYCAITIVALPSLRWNIPVFLQIARGHTAGRKRHAFRHSKCPLSQERCIDACQFSPSCLFNRFSCLFPCRSSVNCRSNNAGDEPVFLPALFRGRRYANFVASTQYCVFLLLQFSPIFSIVIVLLTVPAPNIQSQLHNQGRERSFLLFCSFFSKNR